MKRTMQTVLIFALALAALLGVAALAERLAPREETPTQAEASVPRTDAVTNEMTPDNATEITLSQEGVTLRGMGAEAHDRVVTIAYPGTYRISGTLMGGQLVVDLGDFHGSVYLILDGAELSCLDGPALYVKQADRTTLYLAEGSRNVLRDGEEYTLQDGNVVRDGAAVFSADDLILEGEGALTVSGNAADGIRTKDGLTIRGGAITVYSTDDGLQASDYIEIQGGSVLVGTYGDGLVTKEGGITVSGGELTVASGGDGLQAMTDLQIHGGRIGVAAHGGADYYDAVALGALSAKGMKGENILITGGSFDLDTADDAIHAARDLTVTGGSFRIASGDDAVSAAAELEITGAELTVSRCYEGLEADRIDLEGVTLSVRAENNGADAGEGGLTAVDSILRLDAPRAVSSEGAMDLRGGSLDLAADGTDSLFSFPECRLTGGTVLAFAGTNDRSVLLEKGEPDNSLLFLFQEAAPLGTVFTLKDAGGGEVFSFYRDTEARAVLVASGALGYGQDYTLCWTQVRGEGEDLTSEEMAMTGTVGDGCTVVEPEGGLVTEQPRGGFPGFPGGPRP